MNFKLPFYALLLGSISGCASMMTNLPEQNIAIQTKEKNGKEILGASCDIINKWGTWYVKSPGSTSIHRSNDDIQVTCRKEGLDSGRAVVASKTLGAMYGNIIIGGGLGAMLDHNNGTAYEYPVFIEVVMGEVTTIKAERNSIEQQFDAMTGNSNKVIEPTVAATPASVPGEDNSYSARKLKEINSLYSQGLISQEVYLERQKNILNK